MTLSLITKDLIKLALLEDISNGDITTNSIFSEDNKGSVKIISREDGIFCGQSVVNEIINTYTSLSIKWNKNDGEELEKNSIITYIEGSIKELLTYERVILNFMERLSGISTLSNKMSQIIIDTDAKLVDTRKTTPGWRWLEKYAVKIGGSNNHRFNLSDGILIKDNHKFAAGSISKAIKQAKKQAQHSLKIEAEVDNISEMEDAIKAGADIILLDNFSIEDTKKAVEIVNGQIILESSGNITEKNILDYAKTGIDYISSGYLTYGATWLDFSSEYGK